MCHTLLIMTIFTFQMSTSNLLTKSSKLFYPENSNKLCVAMLITNLAKPEWITINCDENLTTDVMCYHEDVKNTNSNH